jgi:O-antigen ligase
MPLTTGLTLAVVSWGALAFGAVYPWAYWPLFAATAAVGLVGFFSGRSRLGPPPHTTLALGILAIALAVTLQLCPIPRNVLATLSPSTDAMLRRHDLAYAAGAASAHALSIEPDATRLGLAGLLALGIFMIGTATVLSRTGVVRLAQGVAALGMVIAFIGIVQKATATEKIYGFWQPQHHPYQIFGPFVNHNHFAGWMMMALSVAVGLCCAGVARAGRRARHDWRSRVLWLGSAEVSQLVLTAFATLAMGMALVMTLSRSAIICFATTLLLASWVVVRKRTGGMARQFLAAAYLGLLGVMTLAWVGIDPVVNRFTTGGALSGRFPGWQAAVSIARDFPFSGTGLNTYGTAMLDYESADASVHWDAAHNDYVQLAAEGGLLVGIPLVLTLVLLGREIRRRFRDAKDDVPTYWIRVGAVSGLAAMALQESVDFSLQIPGVATLFALLCAIAIHAPRPVFRDGTL